MTTYRATFSLNEENALFLEEIAGSNKSAFINKVLARARQRSLENALLRANQEEAEDAEYQAALSEWDAVLEDGLH